MSPSFAARLNEADHVEKISTLKEPKVKTNGFLFDYENNFDLVTTDNGLTLGLATKSAAEIFAQLQSPAFLTTDRTDKWAVFNPHIFGEISIWQEFTVSLFIWQVTLSAKLLGLRFSPLDFQFAYDMANTED